MSLNLQDMERRLKTLERQIKQPRSMAARAEVHEVSTLPYTGQLADSAVFVDLIAINAAFGIEVVPLKLVAPIRMTTAYLVADDVAAVTNFKIWLYRLGLTNIDRDNPTGSTFEVDLIDEIASGVTNGAGNYVRITGTLSREIRLSPADGHYFVGYAGDNTNGRVLCPGAGLPKVGRQYAFLTSPTPTTLTSPDRITLLASTRPSPLIVLRSATGRYLYEARDI